MLYFRMCNILKFTQNSLVVFISYLLIYSQQFFVTTLLRHIAFMRIVFCFNGFNQQRRRAIEALEARAPPDCIAIVVNSLFIFKKLSF